MADVIYFDSSRGDLGAYFRTGQAWLVEVYPHTTAEQRFGELEIPQHPYHALVYLGLIDELAKLPHLFILGAWEEGIILPPGLSEGAKKVERFVGTLASRDLDVLVMTKFASERVEYRIKLDPTQVEVSFAELAAFFREGFERGYGVQLWL